MQLHLFLCAGCVQAQWLGVAKPLVEVMVVAEVFRCHAPPLFVLVVCMLAWIDGVPHCFVPWLKHKSAELEMCVCRFQGIEPMSACEDNDFTETFSGEAQN